MKTKIVLVLIVLMLSACGSTRNNQSAILPTSTIVALPTSKATPTEFPTPTVPMIEIGGILSPRPQSLKPNVFRCYKSPIAAL